MNVVFDSNIYIAAFATHGLCQALMELCLDTHVLFVSDEILIEVKKALDKKIKLPPRQISEILLFLKQNATLLSPVMIEDSPCRDPNDDHVLGLCMAAKARYLVTGDRDLLDLKSFNAIPILTPRQFWDALKKQS